MSALVEREQCLCVRGVVVRDLRPEELEHLGVGQLVRRRTYPAVLVLGRARHERHVGRVRRRRRIPLMTRDDSAVDDGPVAETRNARLAVKGGLNFAPIDLLDAIELVLLNTELREEALG